MIKWTLPLTLLAVCVCAPAQTLPTGFAQDILVSGLTQPCGLAALPDGRLLIVEQKTAAIKVWTGGATVATVGTVPSVRTSGNEQGLLSIAVDPGWPARPYIYVWFDTTASSHMRLAMFTVTGNLTDPTSTSLALSSQYNILTDILDNASNHNGGSLRFGLDGMLYLSMGDDASSCTAQNQNTLEGKILRLDVSSLPGAGAGPPAKSTITPAGNPFSGPTDNARLIWTMGVRNPFRFHIDSLTGYIYLADVGQNAWEEIDEIVSGGLNMGWPWFEGATPYTTCTGSAPPSVAPIATWSHASGAGSIISLGRYRNQPGGTYNFGSAYEGDYFYLDYYLGAVRRLKHNGSTWAIAPQVPGQPNATDWASGFDSVADALTGADGAIYVVKQFPGSLRRIRQNQNTPTLTIVSGDNQTGNAGLPLQDPFVVRLTTLAGTPIAGQTVNFISTGAGTMNPTSMATDVNGYAQSTLTLASTFPGVTPTVQATTSGAGAVVFTTRWRGITAFYLSILNYFTLTVRHSETNSPVLLTFELPPAGAPYASTPYGDIWTNLFAPGAGFGALDGMGLLGPPVPGVATGPVDPNYTLTVSGVPLLGGITILFQAFAIDSTLAPAPSAFMVSNTYTNTFN